MAITIEKLIEENIHLAYPYHYNIDLEQVTDSYYIAHVEFWGDEPINVGVTVNDEEEITAIEEL
jgi:hypothetical protein